MESIKSKHRELTVAFAILVFSSILLVSGTGRTSFKKNLVKEGYVRAEIDNVLFSNETAVVILKAQGKNLPIYVSISQGKSIASGKADIEGVRPDTHDLIKKILEEKGIEVLGLSIDKLENNIYYGTLYLRDDGIKKVDVRPSDGMAIVTRFNKSIFVKEELLYKSKDIKRIEDIKVNV